MMSGRSITSGCVVTSGRTTTSGGGAASTLTLASGRGIEMHEMSAACCAVHDVKFGVSPEQVMPELCAHDAKALTSAEQPGAERSVEQPVMHDAVSALQPLVMATRAQIVVQVPGATTGVSVDPEDIGAGTQMLTCRAGKNMVWGARLSQTSLSSGKVAQAAYLPASSLEPQSREVLTANDQRIVH